MRDATKMMVGSTWKAKKKPRLLGPELLARLPKTKVAPSMVKLRRLTTPLPKALIKSFGQPRGKKNLLIGSA
ncbi:MAG: hypothetical protein BWY86_00621 [Candidatus Aminicenantes bacterium ADurb.Bin508]|nr:MAG: hypothetical protein BWY86_00621 [Candidatus Aminicenantes bacterium ADurb.Bin508]